MRAFPIVVMVVPLIGAVLLGIYWPGLHGDFFFDDLPNILVAEDLRLESLSIEALQSAITNGFSGLFGRPVAQLSFALNYYYGGLDPFAFKLTNLFIHAASGLLVYRLAFRLFFLVPPSPERYRWVVASGFLATLWVMHPIQLLPVLHVVQRMTSISAFFLLAALLCHLRGREQGGGRGLGWLALGWGVLWPLSFLSKETGLLFPLFALAWELIVQRAASARLDSFAKAFATLAGVGLALVILYLLSPFGQWLWAGYGLRSFSLVERVLTEGRVLWFYLGLILIPRLEAFGLFHDDFTISSGLLVPWTTLPALAGLAGLAGLAWWARKRMPLVSFGLAWFLIGHGMESTVLPLEIAHEHRNYLPLFGVLLAIVTLLMRAITVPGPLKTTGIALAAVMLAYFPFVTSLRAAQFGDEVRRTQLEAQHHRSSARSQNEAGRVLAAVAEQGGPGSPAYSLARTHYQLAGRT